MRLRDTVQRWTVIPHVMCLAAAWGAIALAGTAGLAQAQQKSVLVLYGARREAPTAASVDPVLQRVLSDGLNGHLDYYPEYLDLTRFPEVGYQEVLRQFLRDKYRGQKFDVIVAAGDLPLVFATRYHGGDRGFRHEARA
jgi:hypothetical protein